MPSQQLSKAQGFTLVELLVVLVILGCIAGLVTVSVGMLGPVRELHNEAERLAGLISVLAEEAIIDNQEYGVLLSTGSYQALRYDSLQQSWQTLSSQSHQLPVWAQLSLEREGQRVRLSDVALRSDAQAELDDGEGEGRVPQVLLLSSGEISPFRLLISERRANGVQLQLVSDGFQLPRVEHLSLVERKP